MSRSRVCFSVRYGDGTLSPPQCMYTAAGSEEERRLVKEWTRFYGKEWVKFYRDGKELCCDDTKCCHVKGAPHTRKAAERVAIGQLVSAIDALLDVSESGQEGADSPARLVLQQLFDAVAAFRAAVAAARRSGTPEEDIGQAAAAGAMDPGPEAEEEGPDHWSDAAHKVFKAACRARVAKDRVEGTIAAYIPLPDNPAYIPPAVPQAAVVAAVAAALAARSAARGAARGRFLAAHGYAKHRV